MAEFLTTHGISHNINEIILNSYTKLVLISPYIQLSRHFADGLKDCSSRGVSISIVYGKKEVQEFDKGFLANLKNLKLYYLDNLHTKCYYNEKKMIISSMNLYDFSEKNNREMGILIDSVKDSDIFVKAVSESNSIISNSKSVISGLSSNSVKRYPNLGSKSKIAHLSHSFCIRCELSISFNLSKPLCYTCYEEWARFENAFYHEQYCHCCGRTIDGITKANPLCFSCKRNSSQNLAYKRV